MKPYIASLHGIQKHSECSAVTRSDMFWGLDANRRPELSTPILLVISVSMSQLSCLCSVALSFLTSLRGIHDAYSDTLCLQVQGCMYCTLLSLSTHLNLSGGRHARRLSMAKLRATGPSLWKDSCIWGLLDLAPTAD